MRVTYLDVNEHRTFYRTDTARMRPIIHKPEVELKVGEFARLKGCIRIPHRMTERSLLHQTAPCGHPYSFKPCMSCNIYPCNVPTYPKRVVQLVLVKGIGKGLGSGTKILRYVMVYQDWGEYDASVKAKVR